MTIKSLIILSLTFHFSGLVLGQSASLDYHVSKNEKSKVGFYFTPNGNCIGTKHTVQVVKQPQNGTLEIKWENVDIEKSLRIVKEDGVVKASSKHPCNGYLILSSVYYYTPNKNFTGVDTFVIEYTHNSNETETVTRIIYIE